ncbi:SPOR domain-containing protein [Pontixanthobacter aestiaquae]|uniref:SPOR domain-containing protein n=1 Tax=Pontixanthobacter aestiaquae TaxID=1509367 RepID=A0A844ZCQ8_9SPHN|nr:SPOR domain-containing protein [Pontixanthobacter aestiaquae]MDN3645401.1 SPOR domain-containing protein [Pontixanthobacter aestiaquae]MXO83599.1 hypothetical protein [Pontixanthobacter aestiaquae]
MRLPTDIQTRFLKRFCVLGLSVLLAACGRFGGGDLPPLATAADRPAVAAETGPQDDYPLVVGEPYEVDGQLYTPLDTMNFDEVGYAVLDRDGGNSVSIAHKTLPLPSYVELTSLETGKTILARAERRGPMSNNHVAALSPRALTQLGVQSGAPIRVRRTNPPESERAKLRMEQTANARMDTPKSLLTVLKRKLPETGSVNLAVAQPNAVPSQVTTPSRELPAVASAPARTTPVARAASTTVPKATAASFAQAFTEERRAVTAYPLAPLSRAPRAVVTAPRPSATPRTVAQVAPQQRPVVAPLETRVAPRRPVLGVAARPAPKPAPAAEGAFVVQAAAFSSEANAKRAANSLNGFIQKSGRFYRVRTGPFTNRGQAEAALAKVRAAGYSDARVFTAG